MFLDQGSKTASPASDSTPPGLVKGGGETPGTFMKSDYRPKFNFDVSFAVLQLQVFVFDLCENCFSDLLKGCWLAISAAHLLKYLSYLMMELCRLFCCASAKLFVLFDEGTLVGYFCCAFAIIRDGNCISAEINFVVLGFCFRQ